jgi:hypothetical protein
MLNLCNIPPFLWKMKYNVDERWCFILKKFICGLLVGIALTMGVTVSAVPEIKSAVFSPDIKLIVNGEAIDTPVVSVVTVENPGYMTNYVPARALSEALGATVTWDGKARTISVSTDEPVTASSVPTQSSVTVTTPKETKYKIPFPIYATDEFGVNAYNIYNSNQYAVFTLEVSDALKAKGLIMNNAADYNSLQIVKDGEGILVSDIVTYGYSGKTFIKYDFYLEHIKPLLQ